MGQFLTAKSIFFCFLSVVNPVGMRKCRNKGLLFFGWGNLSARYKKKSTDVSALALPKQDLNLRPPD